MRVEQPLSLFWVSFIQFLTSEYRQGFLQEYQKTVSPSFRSTSLVFFDV